MGFPGAGAGDQGRHLVQRQLLGYLRSYVPEWPQKTVQEAGAVAH